MKRIPEPELMDDIDQVLAFDSAQRSYSIDAIVFWYGQHCGISEGTLVDLGCGPGKALARLLEVYPKLDITGIDGSITMLEQARKNLPSSIKLQHSMLDDLTSVECDVIMSTGTLHHLADAKTFWSAIKLAGNGTRVFVMDILRPDNLEAIDLAIKTLIPDESELFKKDFSNSLKAAYTKEEIEQQLLDADLDLKINVQEKPGAGKIVFIYGQL
jgi:ubiquinone/menaquinone biosynthesis C-methylase UbiE